MSYLFVRATRPRPLLLLALAVVLLPACQSSAQVKSSTLVDPPAAALPPPPPLLESAPAVESPPLSAQRFSLSAEAAPVLPVLRALVADVGLGLEVRGSVSGRVSLSAVDQPLEWILARLAEQAELRLQIENNTLRVSADAPYVQVYPVPYLNMSRESRAAVSLSVELGASGTVAEKEGVARTNNSSAAIANYSDNQFWQALKAGIEAILGEAGKTKGDVQLNSSVGLVSVRAPQRLQRKVEDYIERVVASARRQVLIEATVVEVNLSRSFNSGINWQRLLDQGSGLRVDQRFIRPELAAASEQFSLNYIDQNARGSINTTLKLLEQFGRVKVLSSPKIMALNNQPSILKVVDNRVYFRLNVDSITASGGATSTTIETDINTVPVGFMMSLTPYVGEGEEVILNIRPTISRIIRFVNDPNPVLAANNVVSQIPEIQVREMETVLRLQHNETAIIGGLMQDSSSRHEDGVPGLASLPLLGWLFKGRRDDMQKSELVVFLRPLLVRDPSIEADLQEFAPLLGGEPQGWL